MSTNWYCLRVISNKERKIKERLDAHIERSNWREIVPHIIVPTEKIYKIRNGKKVIQERTLTPGYIMVEADPHRFTIEIIQAIANSKDVIHFLGRDNPEPMKEHEVKRMLSQVDSSEEEGESLADPFIVGEDVKVIEGPFQNFIGTIQEVNEEKKKLKLIIKVFGRGTEVELNFMQVEKQS
ncbi:transcription termination/antitermination protein NusG [Saprospira grandis]|uniref:Transcription termination/antitermination protein NusG n=1 Tax=Saprospira grandis (strain Lewin) TaxID=984262 RepID=H6L450_SAPGL|nr:transcription termination/antitermination protein NusG [Saprospira grandis]AFC25034.1 NusG antitermination factor [Saprospira grandis str. Lewin]WBM73167.1 transcription termination/antitermination protein NusG [Saprospira grandis]